MTTRLIDGLQVGTRVRVLPGRKFPSFQAGDQGYVVRIDQDANVCDVRFDRGGPAIPVSGRHLGPEASEPVVLSRAHGGMLLEDTSIIPSPADQSPFTEGRGFWQIDGLASKVTDVEAQLRRQQEAIGSLDSRLAAWEPSLSTLTAGGERTPTSGAVDTAVEGLVNLDHRIVEAQRVINSLTVDVDRMHEVLRVHLQRAGNLETVVHKASSGLEEVGALLSSMEVRTRDLGAAVSAADDNISILQGKIDKELSRLTSLEQRMRARNGNDQHVQESIPESIEGLWQAMQRVRELIGEEAEVRAAQLRERAATLEQDIIKVRESVVDVDGRVRGEHRRVKQHFNEHLGRHRSHDHRLAILDGRIEALQHELEAERLSRTEALAALEAHNREDKDRDTSLDVKALQRHSPCNGGMIMLPPQPQQPQQPHPQQPQQQQLLPPLQTQQQQQQQQQPQQPLPPPQQPPALPPPHEQPPQSQAWPWQSLSSTLDEDCSPSLVSSQSLKKLEVLEARFEMDRTLPLNSSQSLETSGPGQAEPRSVQSLVGELRGSLTSLRHEFHQPTTTLESSGTLEGWPLSSTDQDRGRQQAMLPPGSSLSCSVSSSTPPRSNATQSQVVEQWPSGVDRGLAQVMRPSPALCSSISPASSSQDLLATQQRDNMSTASLLALSPPVISYSTSPPNTQVSHLSGLASVSACSEADPPARFTFASVGPVRTSNPKGEPEVPAGHPLTLEVPPLSNTSRDSAVSSSHPASSVEGPAGSAATFGDRRSAGSSTYLNALPQAAAMSVSTREPPSSLADHAMKPAGQPMALGPKPCHQTARSAATGHSTAAADVGSDNASLRGRKWPLG